jgi:hypothetical protein
MSVGDGSFVTVATLDAIVADVAVDALADVGIEAQLAPVRRPHQLPGLVEREQVEVRVPGESEAAARSCLEQLREESEGAVDEQAMAAPYVEEPPPASTLGTPSVAFLLAAMAPLLGPIATRSLIATLLSLVANGMVLMAYASLNDYGPRTGRLTIGELMWIAARIADVAIVGGVAVIRHLSRNRNTPKETSDGARS